MKYLSLVFLIFGVSGCYWLRYTWEKPLTQLPEGSIIFKINNDYITYSNNFKVYKAWYTCDGDIFKTEVYENYGKVKGK